MAACNCSRELGSQTAHVSSVQVVPIPMARNVKTENNINTFFLIIEVLRD